jgi:hypothetical protein
VSAEYNVSFSAEQGVGDLLTITVEEADVCISAGATFSTTFGVILGTSFMKPREQTEASTWHVFASKRFQGSFSHHTFLFFFLVCRFVFCGWP